MKNALKNLFGKKVVLTGVEKVYDILSNFEETRTQLVEALDDIQDSIDLKQEIIREYHEKILSDQKAYSKAENAVKFLTKMLG